MDILTEFFKNFWNLTNDMAVYILFGVLFAGVLKQIIPQNFIKSHLGKDSIFSVLKASIFGIPLPLCSCSVIPFATSLKKEGASSGSVLSFLISTPITGVDSIAATYGFFGWIFTIYRVITSLFIAILAGILQNIFRDKEVKFSLKSSPNTTLRAQNISFSPPNGNFSCSGDNCSPKKDNKSKFSIKKTFDYAINDIFKDFAKPLLVGLILGALIATFMPKDLSNFLSNNLALTYLIILLFSMPLYICATSSLPIAASLIASGLSGGAAFVLLSAGPATNSVTISVVAKTLGKKALFIYLGVIGICSLIFGYLLDLYFPHLLSGNMLDNSNNYNLIDSISSVIMLGMIGYFFIKGLKYEKSFGFMHRK